MEWNAMIGND